MKKWKMCVLFLCIIIIASTVCVAAQINNHVEDTENTKNVENGLKTEQPDGSDTAIREEEKSLEEQVQTVLEESFNNLTAALLEDSDIDFSKDDFASIDGYIAAKYLAATRYSYNELSGGIHRIDLEKLTVEELSDQGDHLEARGYVNFTFYYGDNESCRGGARGRVTLVKSGNQYEVTDLDLYDCAETRMIKEASLAKMKVAGVTDPYPFVDAYIEQLKKNTDSMKK